MRSIAYNLRRHADKRNVRTKISMVMPGSQPKLSVRNPETRAQIARGCLVQGWVLGH